jgi:tripartite-type tricarboxylate transporter receptor subunit TctC
MSHGAGSILMRTAGQMARRLVVIGAAGWLAAVLCGPVAAQSPPEWPTRPIRVILPFAPGTGTDVVCRLVFNQLSIQLGQQIVVENRGGAGGTLGTAAVAHADPDGYTVLAHSTTLAITPAIYKNLNYDVVRDLVPVAPFGRMPTVLVMAPSKGIKTVQAFVAAAKAKPNTFTFASAGVGSTTHLTAERFRLSAGFQAIHVPFRGGGFRPEVASGRVDFAFSPIAVAVPDIRDGRLLALAVSGKQRSATLPDTPTTLEAGYPNSDYALWVGIFLPAKTPAHIVERLNRETLKALQTPSLRDRLATLDVEPMPMTPAEFGTFVKEDIAVQGALAKAAGLKVN